MTNTDTLTEQLRTGAVTVSDVQEQYRARVRQLGSDDPHAIAMQRAITRHLSAVNSPW